MRNAGFVLSATLVFAAGCSSTTSTDVDTNGLANPNASGAAVATFSVAEASSPVAPTQDGDADSFLDERWKQLSLAEQKKAYLLEQHMANAADLREGARLEEAYAELEKALLLDSDYLPAKKMKADVGALLGFTAEAADSMNTAAGDQWQRQTQQLLMKGRDNLNRGKSALARGDYTEAIAEFTLCLNHVTYAPAIEWNGLGEEAASLLQRAKAERLTSASEEQDRKRRTAYDALKAEEAEAAAREALVTATMISDAIAAFDRADYKDAMELADQALVNSPRNVQASDVRTAAYRASREQASDQYLQTKREKYAAWAEHMLELQIPGTDVFKAPSAEYWNDITKKRDSRRGLSLDENVSPNELALRAKLSSTVISRLQIPETDSLQELFGIVQTQTGLPIHVDSLAEEAAIDEGVTFDYDLPYPIKVSDLLAMVTEQAGEEVTWTVRHDVVLVTTKEKARGDLALYSHDVNDLILGLTDFMGPRINELRLLDNMEDDDGGGPFGSIGERPTLIEPDDLATLVTDNVAVGQWEDDGVTIDIFEGHMIVVHTSQVQREVKKFLADLRRFNTSLINIESKFMTVGDNWIQEIGVEWGGIDNPGVPFTDLDDVTSGLEDNAGLGLDNGGTGDASSSPSSGFFYDDGADGDFKTTTANIFGSALGGALSTIGGLTTQWSILDDAQLSMIMRAVEKKSEVELINDQILSVFNTQRAYITVVKQLAYIQDFDVEAFQFEVAADPQINVVHEGIVLDVRPTISHDRRAITLEVQPTVATVVEMKSFTTSLGGSTSPVTLELPELEVKSVFTTVEVPDGGSILLGGLSKIRNVERRAEVPWLGKIPVIGFFFKEEGYSDEKQSLMIMIKASITDIAESLSSK
jgi:general secretion pathway protein D